MVCLHELGLFPLIAAHALCLGLCRLLITFPPLRVFLCVHVRYFITMVGTHLSASAPVLVATPQLSATFCSTSPAIGMPGTAKATGVGPLGMGTTGTLPCRLFQGSSCTTH